MNKNELESQRNPQKRPYASPALQVYGNLAEVTANTGAKGLADGPGKGGSNNTH